MTAAHSTHTDFAAIIRESPTIASIREAQRNGTLPASLDVPTAALPFGFGRAGAYNAAKHNRLPFPVIHVGRRMCVPTTAWLRALGLDDDPRSDAA